MNALKRIRIIVALTIFVGLLLLFLDFSQTIPASWHWLAHLQLTPAILGVSVGVLSLWILATLIFGRLYCSCLCPLGILQDIFSRLSGTFQRKILRTKKGQYRFRSEMVKTRSLLLFLFVASLLIFPLGVVILDPYSNFGRMVTSLLRPLYLTGNNVLAAFFKEDGGGIFRYQANHFEYHALFVALAVLVLVGTLSVFFGRRYCNTICPVGTLLGLMSRFSLFKIRLKSDCISCGLCERVCKGECIGSKNKHVDASRCVSCFNCVGSCRHGSLVYSLPLKMNEKQKNIVAEKSEIIETSVDSAVVSETGRRSFLHWSIFSLFLPSIAGSLGASRSTPPPDPSLPTGVSRVGYQMTHAILPPGARNLNHFQKRCTGCHLCVSKCPENILYPSATELGLAGFLQPVMKFDYGFCNFNCTICTHVCPSHALVPITEAEKHRLQIGMVVFLQENCVVETQHTNCGACAEHCPSGAVKMVPFGDPAKNLTIPEVDAELCVGCGACEHICPVRPYRAIYVDGIVEHKEAKLDYDPDAKQEVIELDDFGF